MIWFLLGRGWSRESSGVTRTCFDKNLTENNFNYVRGRERESALHGRDKAQVNFQHCTPTSRNKINWSLSALPGDLDSAAGRTRRLAKPEETSSEDRVWTDVRDVTVVRQRFRTEVIVAHAARHSCGEAATWPIRSPLQTRSSGLSRKTLSTRRDAQIPRVD